MRISRKLKALTVAILMANAPSLVWANTCSFQESSFNPVPQITVYQLVLETSVSNLSINFTSSATGPSTVSIRDAAFTEIHSETFTRSLSSQYTISSSSFNLVPNALARRVSISIFSSTETLSNFSVSSTDCGGSSSSSSSSTATSTTTAVTSDVFTRTTATISGNTRMMDMALTRFLSESNSGAGEIITRDNITGPLGLQVTGFNVDADDDGGFLFSSMSYMDVANGWRRVGFAELSFQDTQGVGSTLSVNGRISQERYLTASTLYGYFLGAELHRSDIKGSFAGDQESWGVLAGAYTVTEAENGMIGSAYAALGFNRSDLNIGDGTTTVTDSYDTRSVMLGAKLSGDLDYTTYRLRPSLAANYVQTHIGTLGMTETTSGTPAPLSVDIGTIRFMDIVATPEFVFAGNSLMEGHGAAEFTVAPRLTCEGRDAATKTRTCGGGLALGVSSNSSDGKTTLNGGVSFDRIGGQDRRAIQLQAEMRF
jgi:hypothetical protein